MQSVDRHVCCVLAPASDVDMPPFWKLKREMARVAQQLSRAHWFVLSPIARRIHDARLSSRLRITDGRDTRSDEMALVLLFQPDGLLASTFHMVDHLRSKGLSVLIVSNAALSDPDREKLAARAWRIIERPNFGYDFGGYRDGILHLLGLGVPLKRLYVLNDSIWFPLAEDSDLVEHARASNVDVYGFVLNDGLRGEHRRHVQSYFMVFSGRLFGHRDFEDFWRGLFLSNNKELVIRRCEVALTEAFRKRGHTVAFRHETSDAAKASAVLDDAGLRELLSYLVATDAKNSERLKDLLTLESGDPSWRNEVLREIHPERSRNAFLCAHPAVLIGALHSPILKKNRDDIYVVQRKALLGGGFDRGFLPAVRDEVAQWDVDR